MEAWMLLITRAIDSPPRTLTSYLVQLQCELDS